MRFSLAAVVSVVLLTAHFIPFGWAQEPRVESSPPTRLLRLQGLRGSQACGEVQIVDNVEGPDSFQLSVQHLKPLTLYTVFLTHSRKEGALPAHYLAEFKTDRRGEGRLKLLTEIINVFASANQGVENRAGIADSMGAGALLNGATTVPLNFIRIYSAKANGVESVFGRSEGEKGGGLVLVSDSELP
ncbi:MAG: hypothetical protein P1V97_12900 [Planctomycetota bacterium]|nr:hypothetical protein [Planctomycetota bacterium]